MSSTTVQKAMSFNEIGTFKDKIIDCIEYMICSNIESIEIFNKTNRSYHMMYIANNNGIIPFISDSTIWYACDTKKTTIGLHLFETHYDLIIPEHCMQEEEYFQMQCIHSPLVLFSLYIIPYITKCVHENKAPWNHEFVSLKLLYNVLVEYYDYRHNGTISDVWDFESLRVKTYTGE
ncbi:hypothetical protein [Salmonella phage SD-15_S21]|nr:hypothetical protein [Salmonella phage SD-15_S21]